MASIPNTLTTCRACGNLIETTKKALARGRGRYCSLSCAASVAARNRDQQGARNPKWKGGLSSAQKRARYRMQFPEKAKAQQAVTRAIERGHLKPLPCLGCGAKKTEAHHPDYSRPLFVIWVCKRCHARLHKTLRRTA